MYILFALLVAVLIYAFANFVLLARGAGAKSIVLLTAVSVVAFSGFLVAFNLLSSAIGVDLGPFREVSYSIPDDYLAHGSAGVAALVVYALSCVAPVFGLGAAMRTER